MMELRSFNVERIYSECVKCSIGNDLGIDKEKFFAQEGNIVDMLSQIETYKEGSRRVALLKFCNRRKDDEIWTPYLQIVEMLIRMGKRLGVTDWEGNLKPETKIYFKCQRRKMKNS